MHVLSRKQFELQALNCLCGVHGGLSEWMWQKIDSFQIQMFMKQQSEAAKHKIQTENSKKIILSKKMVGANELAAKPKLTQRVAYKHIVHDPHFFSVTFFSYYIHKLTYLIWVGSTFLWEGKQNSGIVGSTDVMQEKGPGSESQSGVLLQGVCLHVLPMHGFSPGTSASSHSLKTQLLR